MHALITSPVPSHPQNHGNRARVFAVCRELQRRGYQIHFLYGGQEGLQPDQERAMRQAWEHVYILPKSTVKRQRSRRAHHLIDDWFPDAVTKATQRIMAIWNIDLCLANYVWFSGWLDHVPRETPRLIDTHDIFGNRHKALKRDGIDPSWFYTTPKEEAKALSRASTVIAIQKEEAKVFELLSPTPVETLGFFDEPHYLPALPDAKPARKIKVGYIASNNPINQKAMAGLNEGLTRHPELLDRCSFFLAGPICDTGPGRASIFQRLGFVPSVDGFYEDMDLIVNPNIGGTGLKIKSVEAMRYGRPLLATADAMIGIETASPWHQCLTIPDLCHALGHITEDWQHLLALQEAGRSAYDQYVTVQRAALDRLFPQHKTGKSAP